MTGGQTNETLGRLGEAVTDALETAGYRPYEAGRDGFWILWPIDGDQDHVLVTSRFDGTLRGLGRDVHHQMLGRWEAVLDSAGFAVQPCHQEGRTVALYVRPGGRP